MVLAINIYNIVIICLGILTVAAGICMVIVCYLFCIRSRGEICQQFLTRHGPYKNKQTIGVVQVQLTTEDLCARPIHFLENIENAHDNIKLWKGCYGGKTILARVYKTCLHDFWANERFLYSQPSTCNEFILKYLGYQQRNTFLVILFEHLPIGPLSSYLKGNTVNIDQIIQIVYSVSLGLAHLHSNKFVSKQGSICNKFAIAHRNIKSSNIFVKDENGHCVISDLSQALVLHPKHTNQAKNVNIKKKVGTFQYMSPESLEGRMNLMDTEAFKQIDVYALALVIWEVCSRSKLNHCQRGCIPDHQLPFADIVGENPTLDTMKKIVVLEKKRPPLYEFWDTHKVLKNLKQMMVDSWDEDPEARLTAANIASQLQLCRKQTSTFHPVDKFETLVFATKEDYETYHSEIVISLTEDSQTSIDEKHSKNCPALGFDMHLTTM